MKINTKISLFLVIVLSLTIGGFIFRNGIVFGDTICYPIDGCVGIATTTDSNVGKFLQVASTTPFLVYSFGTSTSGGNDGVGITSSTPFSAGYIPFTTSSNSITNSVIFQSAQNIGIGTTTPSYTLDVNGTIQGRGFQTQGGTISGDGLVAIGPNSIADGTYSVAIGELNACHGYSATCLGYNNVANNDSVVMFGENNIANGYGCSIGGVGGFCNNSYGSVFGENNTTNGYGQFMAGSNSSGTGRFGVSLGNNVINNGMSQVVMGKYNIAQGSPNTIVNTDNALIFGGGTASGRWDIIRMDWRGHIIHGSSTLSTATGILTAATGTKAFVVNDNIHLLTIGTAPTLSSCGTSPSAISLVSSTDISGKVVIGSGITVNSCLLTFTKQWPQAPSCWTNDETDGSAVFAQTTSSTLTVSSTLNIVSDTISYGCIGNKQ